MNRVVLRSVDPCAKLPVVHTELLRACLASAHACTRMSGSPASCTFTFMLSGSNGLSESDESRPAELGFDIILESATKYLKGHNDVIAGVYAGSAAHVQQVTLDLCEGASHLASSTYSHNGQG